MRLSLPIARLTPDLGTVIRPVASCNIHKVVALLFNSKFAMLDIDYRLYPLSYKYADLLAYVCMRRVLTSPSGRRDLSHRVSTVYDVGVLRRLWSVRMWFLLCVLG